MPTLIPVPSSIYAYPPPSILDGTEVYEGVGVGVTVAGTSLIGNSIGENNKKNTLNYFTHIIIFGIIISFVITFLGLTYSEKVFSLMGSSDKVISLGLEYTNIIYSGSFLFILVVSLNSFLLTLPLYQSLVEVNGL